jgi:hypothetical protein
MQLVKPLSRLLVEVPEPKRVDLCKVRCDNLETKWEELISVSHGDDQGRNSGKCERRKVAMLRVKHVGTFRGKNTRRRARLSQVRQRRR